MSDNLEGWKTQKESKHAVHHVESPFGGETVAGRKEMEVHRMSDSLSEKARRDLVQAKMAALAKSIIDTEREYFIKTLWQLNLTQEERADLMKLLREQGIEHLLPGPGEETGERRRVEPRTWRSESTISSQGQERNSCTACKRALCPSSAGYLVSLRTMPCRSETT